jgi:hypothetical protein
MEAIVKENTKLKERLLLFNGKLNTVKSQNKIRSMFYPEEKLVEYKEQTKAMDYLVKEHVEGLSKITEEEVNSDSSVSFDSFKETNSVILNKEVNNIALNKETLKGENIEDNFSFGKRPEEEKLDMLDNAYEQKAEGNNTTRSYKELTNQIIQLPRCSIVKKTSRNVLIGHFKEDDSLVSDRSNGFGNSQLNTRIQTKEQYCC